MKLKKLISSLLCIAIVIGIIPAMSLTASAKDPTPIQDTTIRLDSGVFKGGKAFPEFSVQEGANYYVEEATFYKEMCDYYVGDKLPSYKAGTTINNVVITLKPNPGYFFGWGGQNDGKSYESTVYTVEYKGKTYTPYVVHDQAKSEMTVYLDVTFEDGEIYATTFKDLDIPYHYGPLDRTVTVSDDLELLSVEYTMFNKQLDSFANGDNISIGVRVKSKDPKNTFNKAGYAYWADRKVNSDQTIIISPTEAVYVFQYKVQAIDEQIIKTVDLRIPEAYDGEALPTNAFTDTDGIKINSVTWTPNDAKADKNKEYTVRIEFTREKEFIYADDFEEQAVVRLNGKIVDLKKVERETGGAKKKFTTVAYYIEATFRPVFVAYTDINQGTTTIGTKIETVTIGTATTTPTEVYGEIKNNGTITNVTGTDTKNENYTSYTVITAHPFTDVSDDSYAKDAIIWAYTNGITSGTSATTFGPFDSCTRGQVVTFLWRAAGKPSPTTKNNPFTDVKPTDYFYEPVLWAVEKGITAGTSATEFSPDTTCSSAHIITFLYRAMGIGANGWYEEAKNWAINEGFLSGTGISVSPDEICPRGAVVTFLYRIYN